MAYRPQLAAALSGASVGQLAYWRRADGPAGALLVPETSSSPLLYSFRDVVALRTAVYLRERLSLQRIRRALGSLRDLGEVDHLSSYQLLAQGHSVVLVPQDGPSVDLVERPGQQVTTVVLAEVLRPFTTSGDITVPDLLHPRRSLRVDPDVRGGHPTISGSRVPFDLVAALVRDGVPVDEVGEYYPGVTADAADDALDFANYVERYNRAPAAA
ncbi:uncharacterized protein (DUF433 family) [Kribbella amoyensis]|uniref:Uncharacterized protein (DUF433 family) n=1 Tax=Kribbella amoyensis TaxID=996641 RepID=A0A561BN96_9ACTN|nr:DUF433 domain-containing protein [Kribbella amoyensis]TWD80345.1 uncharacterized protein (DUF433 family) [Kribbella amoyensis]